MIKNEIEMICEKLKPIVGKKVEMLYYLYLFESDLKKKRDIEIQIRVLAQRHINQLDIKNTILLPPPPDNISDGDFCIGNIEYNGKEIKKYAIKRKNLIRHVAIFGCSGSGKTNLMHVILRNGLVKNSVPFMLFDWKRNYRDILEDVDSKKMDVFTIGRDISPFNFNPLMPPPGTSPKAYLPKLIEIIAHAFFLGEGVMYLLLKCIDDLYEKNGVYSGRPEKYPTMRDVLEWFTKYKASGRELLWYQSTIRTIASLNYGDLGKSLNVQSGMDLAETLNKQVIFELDSLSSAHKVFFIETILLWIHHYRLGDGKREELKHVIVIEEAHHIMLKQKQEMSSGESIIDIIIREIRELGEGIIMIDQMPSLFSLTGMANSFTTITFNLKTAQDVKAIADAMMLKDEERDYPGMLEVGEAIVKMQGGWYRPFLIKVPLISLKKGSISDEYVRKVMKGTYSTDSRSIKTSIGNSEKPKVIQEPDKSISSLEAEYLKYVLEHPLNGTVQRYKHMGISQGAGNECKDALIKKGFIEPVEISTKNGRVVLVQLTEAGKRMLEKMGLETTKALRFGGLVHEYWKEAAAQEYEQKGYSVVKEHPIGGGKAVDLMAEKDGNKIVVEIETGKSNALENIEKCINLGFYEIVSVSTNRKSVEELKKAVEQKKYPETTLIRIIHVKEI